MFSSEYFDTGLYRVGTACEKWDVCRAEHGAETLPMWVADMDFPSPPAVQEAILRRAAHPTWGYTEVEAALPEAVSAFWARRHGTDFAAGELTLLPCVVTGLKTAIRAYTRPGEGVLIQSPVYGPFRMAVEATGRKLLDAPLVPDARGRYHMDLQAVEAACRAGAKLMMLCSPHNPVSRLWSREELTALLEVLGRWGVPLVSDEIHADFEYEPHSFVSVRSLAPERTVTLLAPSKTFNLAGLQTAFAVIADEWMRARFADALASGGVVSGNIFGLEAARAAFEQGDAWLDGLLAYLRGNRETLARELAAALPEAVLTPMEATYLGWMDLRAYGFHEEELLARCGRAGVMFTEGTFFGAQGDGFLRINIGCPRRNIAEAVARLRRAIVG